MSSTHIESPLLPHIAGYVGGQWRRGSEGTHFDVHNPATGERLAEIPAMDESDVLAAIDAGKAVLWPPPSLEERKRWLTAIADHLVESREELGRILTLEHGKPWKEAKGEVDYAAGFFRYASQHLDALAPREVPNVSKGGRWTVYQRPAGVVGLITPWNFPIGMIAKKLSAAIAAGCPSVIKPASKTPLTMIALFTLLDRIELPAGFVNLVMGSASKIGRVLCDHPDVPVISFTGSTEVGKQLIRDTEHRVKRLALELGGNAPFVVFADADLESAADHLIANKFRAGGQTCVCSNRVLVQKQVAERFAELVAERAGKLVVGDGMDASTDIGPMIDRAGWEKVHEHVRDALSRGAKRVLGEEPSQPTGDVKAFFPPTVLRGVTAEMACCREETFGPLVPIMEFADEAEAIREANHTQYGLAAYVFTADDQLARRVVEQLSFGHVGLNTGTGPAPEAPFGGMKESGYGREGGLEGLHEFVEPQTVAQP